MGFRVSYAKKGKEFEKRRRPRLGRGNRSKRGGVEGGGHGGKGGGKEKEMRGIGGGEGGGCF